jgi:hypothetical protein
MPRPRKDPKPAAVPVAAAPQPVALVPQQAPAPAPVSLMPQGLPADNNAAPLVINRAEYVRVRDSVSLRTPFGALSFARIDQVLHGFDFMHASDTPGMPSHIRVRAHTRVFYSHSHHNTSKPCQIQQGLGFRSIAQKPLFTASLLAPDASSIAPGVSLRRVNIPPRALASAAHSLSPPPLPPNTIDAMGWHRRLLAISQAPVRREPFHKLPMKYAVGIRLCLQSNPAFPFAP